MPTYSYYCGSCDSCLVINFACIIQGNTPLHGNLAKKSVLSAAKEAQDFWLKSILQEDCLTELCAALAADLAETTPLPDKWKNLLNDYIVPMMIKATTYQYILTYGIIGLNLGEISADKYIQSIYGTTIYLQKRLRTYLEENYADFTCFTLPEETCTPTEDEIISDMGFDTLTRYPYDTLN